MNKLSALTFRNIKEIIRDPLSLVFCIGFPVVMLVLMQAIIGHIPGSPEMFNIVNYAPGICVFGYTFSMLFVAMIIAHDKNTEFVNRLNIAPIKKSTYIFSYVLGVMPVVVVQTLLFFAISLCFGLPFSANTALAFVCLIPSAIFYVVLGVLLGNLSKSEKQVGPICSIIISLAGMLGGVFMPVQNMGAFSTIANALPFWHTVQLGAGAITLQTSQLLIHLAVVVGYSLLVVGLTYIIHKRRK